MVATRAEARDVIKRQRMWLTGNALEDWDLDLGELLDGDAFCGNVDVRLCGVLVTLSRGEHGGVR